MSPARLLLPAFVYAGILTLSSLPADQLDGLDLPAGMDYLAHAVEYAALGASLRWALAGTRRPLLLVVLIGAALAVGDETFQSTVPGRDPSALDALVDVTAVTVAGLVTPRLFGRQTSGTGTRTTKLAPRSDGR